MMNRYKEETLQVHAPADLIRRTKLAVQEEEKRISAENIRLDGVARSDTLNEKISENSAQAHEESHKGTDARWQNKKGMMNRVYRWMYPAAGAAVLFVIVAVTVMTFRNGNYLFRSMSSGDTAACEEAGAAESTDMGIQFETSDMTAENQPKGKQADGAYGEDAGMPNDAAAGGSAPDGADMGADGIGNRVKDSGAIGEADMIEMDKDDSAAVNEALENAGGYDSTAAAEKYSDETADEYKSERNETPADDNAAEAGDDNGVSMSVTEVEKAPAFYGEPETEHVIIDGITLHVTKDWYGSMAAYAEIDGKQYVIVGGEENTTADPNEFAQKGYELLKEAGYIGNTLE